MNLISNKYFKYLILICWIITFYILITNNDVANNLQNLCRNNIIFSPFIFVLMQLVLSILVLPCSPITILAGVIWGIELGIIISIISTLISSVTTFYLGRCFFKITIKEKDIFNVWSKLDNLINKYSWKSALIAHANPFFPGSSLGYLFGASDLTFKLFFIGSILGTIPLQLLAVFFGDTIN